MESKDTGPLEEQLQRALKEFEDPKGHAAADARLTPHLLEAAREHELIRKRSRAHGNDKIYR